MWNFIPLSQARQNDLIVIIDNGENDPHFGILELILKNSELIKIVGV